MQKKIILVVVALIIIGGGAYAISHKSSPGTPASSNNSSTPPATTPKPAAAGAVIETKTSSTAGTYLANGSGEALYTYSLDSKNVSNCTGSCLTTWPIYVATSSSADLPANVTTFTRSDGGLQYAYKGMPLYTFTGDSSGQVNGDGVNNFHVAKP